MEIKTLGISCESQPTNAAAGKGFSMKPQYGTHAYKIQQMKLHPGDPQWETDEEPVSQCCGASDPMLEDIQLCPLSTAE